MSKEKKKGEKMKKVVEIAHDIILRAHVHGTVADFTLGAGYDCEMLMGIDEVDRVYAFEIQSQAIQDAKAYLQGKKGFDKVIFLPIGHEQAKVYIQEPICAGIFNFGYYPKGDPTITTTVGTSREGVKAALDCLQVGGLLILVCYPGHEEGMRESLYFDDWIQQLPSKRYDCVRIQMSNKKNCPYIHVIEKKR